MARRCAPCAGSIPRDCARPACPDLDRAAGAPVGEPAARSRRRRGARTRVAARLLEAAAVAVVDLLRGGLARGSDSGAVALGGALVFFFLLGPLAWAIGIYAV